MFKFIIRNLRNNNRPPSNSSTPASISYNSSSSVGTTRILATKSGIKRLAGGKRQKRLTGLSHKLSPSPVPTEQATPSPSPSLSPSPSPSDEESERDPTPLPLSPPPATRNIRSKRKPTAKMQLLEDEQAAKKRAKVEKVQQLEHSEGRKLKRNKAIKELEAAEKARAERALIDITTGDEEEVLEIGPPAKKIKQMVVDGQVWILKQ
jgi:hypothetical protein